MILIAQIFNVMFVDIHYFNSISKALQAVSESGKGIEIIAAECVTCKKDFVKRAEMRPEMPVSIMSLKLAFDEKDDGDIFRERYEMLPEWLNYLAVDGVFLDQFVIFCDTKAEPVTEYHILVSLINRGGYNVDIRKLEQAIKSATEGLQYCHDLCDDTCIISGNVVELPLSLCDEIDSGGLRYGSVNPLNHELVLPLRDAILGNLKKTLFDNV